MSNRRPTFQWSYYAQAAQSQIQCAHDIGFSNYEFSYQLMGSGNEFTPGYSMSDDTYYWRVRTNNGTHWSDFSAIRIFTIDATPPGQPTLVSPADQIVTNDNTTEFVWSTVPTSDIYHLQLDNDIGFGSADVNITTSNNYYTPELVDDIYYWRVRAVDNPSNIGTWSINWSIEIDHTIPIAPSLIAPSEGNASTDNTPYFVWSEPSYAVLYQLVVDSHSDFSGPATISITLSDSYFTSPTIDDNTYYWHVRAANSDTTWGEWSDVWNFTVAANAPAAPTLTTPTDAIITSDTTPTLVWTSVYQGIQYQVQVSESITFSTTIVNLTSSTTSYQCSILGDEIYYWRVRAQNVLGTWGSYSSIYSFEIDTTGPLISDLVLNPSSPDDDDPVTFNCTAIDDNAVTEVRFFYRIDGGVWLNSSMNWVIDDDYTIFLGTFNYGEFVQYYVTALDDSPSQILAIEDNGGAYYSFTVSSCDFIDPNLTSIMHTPTTPNQREVITINCSVTDANGIASVVFYYRIDCGSWLSLAMSLVSGSEYAVTIGPFSITEYDYVHYYIVATDNSPNSNTALDDNGGAYYYINIIYEDLDGPLTTNIILTPNFPTDQDNVTISCIVTDPNGVYKVYLYYRVNNGSWIDVEMYELGGFYVMEFTPFNGNDLVQYYFYAIDDSPRRNVYINDYGGNHYHFTVTETTVAGPIDSILPIFFTALGLILFIAYRKRKLT